jgi:hypothetical protein
MPRRSHQSILSPVVSDLAQAWDDLTHLRLASAFTDITNIPSDFVRAVEDQSASLVDDIARPRTGSPYIDGLIGIEPNPGPPKLPKKSGSKSKGQKLGIGGRRRLSSGLANPTYSVNGAVMAPSAFGTSMSRAGPRFTIRTRMARVLDSNAHIITGRCAIQNFASNAGGGAVFQDSNNNQSSFVYLNPRICCQNSAYNVPAGNCPIGVIAQPFRKFSFRKAVLHYLPTAASTTNTSSIAVAYDPEVVTSSSLGSSVMAYANFEASAYGPVWQTFTLNLTPFLDRSRWYMAETPSAINTSVYASQNIQGTIMLCPTAQAANSTLYGMFYLDFELALSELGPTEVFSVPALGSDRTSSSSAPCHAHTTTLEPACKGKNEEAPVVVVTEEYIIVNGEKKLLSQSTSK